MAGVVQNGGDPVTFDLRWRKAVGLRNHSRQRHEHQFLAEVLQEAATRGRLNIKNLKVAEKLVRRLRRIEREQRRVGVVVTKGKHDHSSVLDERGGIKTPAFDKHVAEQERLGAKRMKGEAVYAAAVKEAAEVEKKRQVKRGSGSGVGKG